MRLTTVLSDHEVEVDLSPTGRHSIAVVSAGMVKPISWGESWVTEGEVADVGLWLQR